MLEGKQLILATKQFAQENRTTSWVHLLSTLLLLVGTLLSTFFVPNWYFKLPISILGGLLMIRMFIIYHDHQHHAILNKSAIANAIMIVFGVYILAPSSIWKRSHDYHHSHNSKLFSASIGSYPIASKAKFAAMSKKEQKIYLAVRHPLTILFGYFSMFIFGMCINSFMSAPRKHYDSLISLILHFSISALLIIFLGWQAWFFAVGIPHFIASCMGAYLFYAQHNFPTTTFAENKDWKYEKAALESSSYMVMSPLMNWFTGNIGYHHIHHLNARIPFYRLPEAYKAIPELQNAKTTSLKIKDVIACFRLKVWDPERDKMVSLKEAFS
ncbi:MAG: fatty acid desaturase [Flavipsychrobacter sp.]